MKMNIGFVIDPLQGLQEAMDTSLLMISEANARGHAVAYCTIDDLRLAANQAQARWTRIHYRSGITPLADCSGESFVAALSQFDAIVMRKDPPFDKTYLAVSYLLDYAHTLVINSPRGLREVNEKLFLLRWPELAPKGFVMRNIDDILALIAQEGGGWVIKPLDLCGGQNVFRVTAGQPDARALVSTVTAHGSEFAVVQEFIPRVTAGDKRIFLVDGDPIGWMNRLPPDGDFRANIHLGARPEACDLVDRDWQIIHTIKPTLIEQGLAFVCLDVIDGRLTEINVTSPSGIPEINRVTNTRCETALVDYIESKID
jgi:glutathione synthase